MPKTYIDFIKELPAPTTEQIKNFVELVAKDHSWYKHLPSKRTIPFVFYLCPNAAIKLVALEENWLFSNKTKFKFEEIEDDKLAQQYINKYGYWRYNSLDKVYRQSIGLNVIDNERFLQPLSFSDSNDILCLIPKELIEKFTFNMSRYLHPVYKDSCDYFDDDDFEKSYAQMHSDIIFDLNMHLTSIVNLLYRY